MGTLLFVLFAASFAGFVTSTVVMYKLLTSKKTQ
jgi:uncharacterized membrane protein